MLFSYPIVLPLLALAPVLAWLGFRAGGRRRWLVAGLRFAAIAAAVLSLARPVVRVTAPATAVVVVELGPAVSDAALANAQKQIDAARSGGADLRVVAFSNRAQRIENPLDLDDADKLRSLRTRLAAPVWPDDTGDGGANLAAAIQLAGAQIPPNGSGRITLCVSGRNDHGDAAAEAYRLSQRGIAVDVVSTEITGNSAEAVIRRLTLPPTGPVGQTVPAAIEFESTLTGPAVVTVDAGDGNIVSTVVNAVRGKQTAKLALPLRKTGLIPVTAGVRINDTKFDGGVHAAVDVAGPTRVLVVQNKPSAGTSNALAALLGRAASVETVTPAAIRATALSDFGAIVLADVAASDLSGESQAALKTAVSEGTGLFVTGATKSFGPGGYDESSLAEVLPVRSPQLAETIDPSTTLVIVLDTSASMGGMKIDLAKEVARLAIAKLRPQDKVGIVEFFGGRHWAAPIQSASNVAVIGRALSRLSAGGGTTLYPAVEEAAFALRDIDTRTKNVLVLSDGFVENAPFAALCRQMVQDGIAVSTVACGPPTGQRNMMPEIARWGRGRYYTVPDQFALPDIAFKQPQVSLRSPMIDTPTEVSAANDPLTRGVETAAMGTVNGYVRTVAKRTADVLLRTADGDPLLVRWRYGAGFVATLPTQLGSTMTQALQDRPAFGKLFADLIRQISSNRGSTLDVRPTLRPAGIEVAMTAADPDAAPGNAGVTVTLEDENGAIIRTTTARPTAAGQWNILFPGVTAGVYRVRATVDGKTTLRGAAGVAVPKPRAMLFADKALFDRIADFAPLAASRAKTGGQAFTFFELQRLLATGAVVLLLLHVTVRRWPASRR